MSLPLRAATTAAADLAPSLRLAHSEFILGGQKSGKSRRAEQLAVAWLNADPRRQAVLIATAHAGDAEMQQRIARHQRDRLERVPRLHTVEESTDLAGALRAHSRADTMLLVDCMTLWLTHALMPLRGAPRPVETAIQDIFSTLATLPGPVVLVGNEIGLGVVPMGPEVRAFVDALGLLNQGLAQACERVTLMVAGLPLVLKGAACADR